MAWGHEKQAAEHYHTVGLNDLRLMIADRLQTAQRSHDPAGLSASFARANDNAEQDSFLGSLLFGMLCWTPFMAAFNIGAAGGALGAAHGSWVSAAVDGLSLVWDEKAHKNRRRRRRAYIGKDGMYHGGRRQEGSLSQKEMVRTFNLVSANENARFGKNAGAEIASLNAMLDDIDLLARKGVRLLSLNENTAVSASLGAALAPSSPKNMHRKSVAMRIAI